MDRGAIVRGVSRQLLVQAVEVVAEASDLEWNYLSDQELLGSEVWPLCSGGRECDGEQLDRGSVLRDHAECAKWEWWVLGCSRSAGDAVEQQHHSECGSRDQCVGKRLCGADADHDRY